MIWFRFTCLETEHYFVFSRATASFSLVALWEALLLFIFFVPGDKQLDGYQKKKYVCKLLFIFLLGHDIDFGHMEAVNLLSSNKYTEKQIVSYR